jgi:sensor c-di-GMP phosphodiesterase-like protein
MNLSPESLRSRGFGADLIRHLRIANLSKDDVLFELTEGSVMDLAANTRENIGMLLALGYQMSADDFGTGYSSLSYLQELNLREIKIDRSFIMRLGSPEGASDAIVRAILAMAKVLGLQTVAEGIESDVQLTWLRKECCDLGQGYHFAKGMSKDAFMEQYLGGDRFMSKRELVNHC